MNFVNKSEIIDVLNETYHQSPNSRPISINIARIIAGYVRV